MNDEPEAKNEETAGECGERVVGAPVCMSSDFNFDNVGIKPFACPASGEDADTAVVGEAVGLDELRGGAGVVKKGHSQGRVMTGGKLSVWKHPMEKYGSYTHAYIGPNNRPVVMKGHS